MEKPQDFISSQLQHLSLQNNTLESSSPQDGSPTYINKTKGDNIWIPEFLEKDQSFCSDIKDLSIKDNFTVDTVAEQIAKNLNEPNKDLIYKIVKTIGIEEALKIYAQTRQIELSGGISCKDGSRRKKPGGVFFYLIHHDESIVDEKLKKIFAEESQKKYKQKKKEVQEERKKRTEELRARIIEEGLLSLNDRNAEV